MIIRSLTSKLLLVFFLVGLTSCATTGYISQGYDYSIMDIQKAIKDNLPAGIGYVSDNRRVFYSKKFLINQDKKSGIPLVMRIVIGGDRRPYTLITEIKKVGHKTENIEQSFIDGDTFVGQDSLAKRVVTKIEDQLAQRRKNKNIFDDFVPF